MLDAPRTTPPFNCDAPVRLVRVCLDPLRAPPAFAHSTPKGPPVNHHSLLSRAALALAFASPALTLGACPSPAVPVVAEPAPTAPEPPRPTLPGAELDLLPAASADLPPGAVLRLGSAALSQSDEIHHVALSADGTRVYASAIYDNRASVWDVATGKKLMELPAHDLGNVEGLATSPDGKRLATAYGTAVLVTDRDGASATPPVRVNGKDIVAAAWSPDGTRLAIGHREGKVDLADAATGKITKTLRGKDEMFDQVAFSPDGTRVAGTGSPSGKTMIWDAKTGKTLLAWATPETGYGRALAWLADGTLVVACSEKGQVVLFAPAAQTPKATPTATWTRGPGIASMVGTGTGHLVVGHFGGGLAVVDPATGKTVVDLVPQNPDQAEGGSYVNALAVGGGRIASGWINGRVRVFEADGRPATANVDAYHGAATAVAWSSDGRWLATGAADGSLLLWRGKNGQPWRTLRPELTAPKWALGAAVADVAIRPNSTLVAVAQADQVIRIWDAATGDLLKALSGPSVPTTLAFSPDGKSLAVGHLGGEVILVDVATWKGTTSLKHPSAVMGLAFIGGSDKLAVGLASVVALWDLSTQKVLGKRERNGFRPMTQALAVTADGKTLFTGGFGGDVDRWDLTLGEQAQATASYPHDDPDNMASNPVSCLAVAPDGAFASGGLQNDVSVFAADGKRLTHSKAHGGELTDLAFSPDGKHLASASKDGTVLIWRRD